MPFFDWETIGAAINEAMATTTALLFGLAYLAGHGRRMAWARR